LQLAARGCVRLATSRINNVFSRAQLLVCTPVRASRGGFAFQLGAPAIPQPVQSMRGPNLGAAMMSSGQAIGHRMTWPWQSQHDTSKQADAALAHVAERHRLDRLVEAGHLSAPTTSAASHTESNQGCLGRSGVEKSTDLE
jgi:hypothetical protein